MEIKKEVKKKFLLDIVSYMSKGLNPTQISKELNISKQKLNYYLKTLKQQGFILKVGYGSWEVKEVKKSTKDTLIQDEIISPLKEVRGHAFIWKVKVPKEIKGYNSLQRLKQKNIKYKLVGLKETPRIICLNKKVWLGNNNLIIYDSSSYLDYKSTGSRKKAVYRLIQILEYLEKTLKISLKTTEGYQFKPRREHYALIKNDLAQQYNQEGKKLNIRYKGETWFIIDNSYNLDEAETIGQDSLIDNLGVQKFFNELKELNFEATPKQTWKAINQVTQNQLMFAENMKSHISAIQELASAVHELRKEIKQRNIKEDYRDNKKIWDF